MKVGLCLSGGGSMGYAHIGAIRALTEAGIKIDMVNGTSIGAVIGGAYALYQDTDKITELAKQVVKAVNINYFNIFHNTMESQTFLRNWLTAAVCNIAAMRKSIQSHHNNLKALKLIFGEQRFEDTKIPFSAVSVDLITGKTVIIKKGKLIDGILPSTSIPGIFPPVPRGKKLLVDGYVLANVPVTELRQQGADFIISIELFSAPDTSYQNGMDILNHIEFIKQNRLQQWALADSDFHIKIDMPKFDSSNFGNYQLAMEHGYKTAKKVVPRLKAKLEKADV
ncbi:MAG: patatin-like phospholipase family protein [Dehalococcoidales bacterium]|nr:patatin-like phospholipase family protein [Dehalococcoidales bacterium]